MTSRGAARSGLPLPALTADDAASQLAWRVLGPDRARVDPVLLWLRGDHQAARAAGWNRAHVDYKVRLVRKVGLQTPLRERVLEQLSDDGGARIARIRRLFGLPRVARSQSKSPLTAEDRVLSGQVRPVIRILTILGPLSPDETMAVLERSRRYLGPFRRTTELADELVRLGGQITPDGI